MLYYALKRINQYELFILKFQRVIKRSSEKMKQVDSAGIYEAEDETGFFFEQIKSIQNTLDGIFGNEENQEKNDVKKSEK